MVLEKIKKSSLNAACLGRISWKFMKNERILWFWKKIRKILPKRGVFRQDFLEIHENIK